MKTRYTQLRCDHISWGMWGVLMTPSVAILGAVAFQVPALRFLAGLALGVWLCQWQVVAWAWLTRCVGEKPPGRVLCPACADARALYRMAKTPGDHQCENCGTHFTVTFTPAKRA